MTPYYQDAWLTVYGGDCREVMRLMEPESVHCVVTSPPYWGLRDYGTATWTGGEADCEHRIPATGSTQNKGNNNREGSPFRERCERCGAIRVDGQLGLEATPEEYVANLVDVFREVRRVLRKDGTVWLNLGDSYAGGGALGRNDVGITGGLGRNGGNKPGSGNPGRQGFIEKRDGLKPKDLVGIPWRVAFALQADGWYLRSDIIWAKPNPMPESVTDRPTKSHEYLFLLSKSARYYYDADAVREEHTSIEKYGVSGAATWRDNLESRTNGAKMSEPSKTMARGNLVSRDPDYVGHVNGRNLRSVWTIATQPYPGAHFATFPRKLVEPCIKAGCPENGVVLDPFAGSGTTGAVAQALGRRAILIDLNLDYLKQAMTRNRDIPLGLVG